MNYRNPKLLSLARGQSCSNCPAEDETIVSAHSNFQEHGKGKSIKAHDVYHAHLCMRCHSWLDQGTGMDPTGLSTKATERGNERCFKERWSAPCLDCGCRDWCG